MSPLSHLLFKKALYRAKHRGSKEADFLLGGFVETYGASLNEEEIFELNFLLEYDDTAIFSWLNMSQMPPVELKTTILERMRTYLHEHLHLSNNV